MYADARKRAAAGEIHPVKTTPDCERTPGTPATGDIGVFDCFMVTNAIPKGEANPAGALGYPFRAVVDYRTFTYNWCKTEQIPGEMMVLASEGRHAPSSGVSRPLRPRRIPAARGRTVKPVWVRRERSV